jgi:MoxR-like ATPase
MSAVSPTLAKSSGVPDREPVHDLLPRIEQQVSTIIVGKSEAVRLALACLLARGHLLIEDIPGVGKTTLAQAVATTLGLPFRRIQFTSDLLPADILGVSIYDSAQHNFRFQPGPIFTSVVLADEVNRAPPKTQSALLEAMEERQVTSDGQTRVLPDPFFVIATQNPTEQSGAYPLPESQLDRFLMCLELGYPDVRAERELLAGGDRRARLSHLAALCDVPGLIELQHRAAHVHVSPALLDYVLTLVAASRAGGQGGPGLSPRAGLNLLNASRAWALLQQRSMVLPEDVQAVFPSVAGHRLASDRRRGVPRAMALLESVAIP